MLKVLKWIAFVLCYSLLFVLRSALGRRARAHRTRSRTRLAARASASARGAHRAQPGARGARTLRRATAPLAAHPELRPPDGRAAAAREAHRPHAHRLTAPRDAACLRLISAFIAFRSSFQHHFFNIFPSFYSTCVYSAVPVLCTLYCNYLLTCLIQLLFRVVFWCSKSSVLYTFSSNRTSYNLAYSYMSSALDASSKIPFVWISWSRLCILISIFNNSKIYILIKLR